MAMKEYANKMIIRNGELNDEYRLAHNALANSMLKSTAPYDGSALVVVRADGNGNPVVREESNSGLTDEQKILFTKLVDAAKASVNGSRTRTRCKSEVAVEKE